MTLTEFLLARFEDDRHRWLNGVYDDTLVGAQLAKRMAIDLAAKRRIVEILTDPKRGCDVYTADSIGLALAMPYADHPAFREEWR